MLNSAPHSNSSHPVPRVMIQRRESMFSDVVRFLLLMSLAIAFPALAQSTAPGAADEPSAEVALKAYVTGLRTGSLEKLQELFLPEGQFCAVASKPAHRIDCKRFSDLLGGWVAEPDPLASGRVIHRKDATPSMSAITYELDFGGTRYIDQLLLYRIEGRWRIVAKTTTPQ